MNSLFVILEKHVLSMIKDMSLTYLAQFYTNIVLFAMSYISPEVYDNYLHCCVDNFGY